LIRLVRLAAGFAGREPTRSTLTGAVRGRVVLVTGASEGIGAATARRLGAAGAVVLLVSRTRERLEKVRDEIVAAGGRAHVHVADLALPEEAGRLAAAVLAEHGHIDVVVSNAGHSIRRSVDDSAGRFHDVARLAAVNYLGPVRLLLDLLPAMRERGRGHIVNVSTVALGLPAPNWTAYLSSKGAFDTWLKTAAPELRADGIGVSNIYLGLVRTRMSAPTALYRRMPAMTAEEAAQVICRAMVRRGRWYPWWGRLTVTSAVVFPGAAQLIATTGVRLAQAGEPLRVLTSTGAVRPARLLRLAGGVIRYGVSPPAVLTAGAPGQVAVIDADGPATYGELGAAARRIAGDLDRAGIRRGARVGLDGLDGRHLVAALIGTGLAGADAVMLTPGLPEDRATAMIHRTGVTQVLCTGPDGVPVLTTPEDLPSGIPSAAPFVPGRSRHRIPRVIPLTSGTTGVPEPAPRDLTLRALIGPVTTHLAKIPVRSGNPMVVAAPTHHGYGLTYLFAGLTLGCPVVLGAGLPAERLLELIREHDAHAVVLLPIHLRRLTATARRCGLLPEDPRTAVGGTHPFPRLRAVVSGAATLSPSALADGRALFGHRIFNLYGTTEAAWAAIATPADLRAAPGTVGRPPRGIRLHITGPEGEPVPLGRTGQVLVEGWHAAGRRIPTGDLGHLDVTGRLFLDGRVDEMIVSGGENVFPGPVVSQIEAHSDVLDATVYPVEDTEFGQRFAAIVCRRSGSALTADDLRTWLRPRLARVEMPRELTVVDEVPRTATGKPLRP
jgi:acyl-CoA synthetase (AMP-forming)/AMP-acid ligase II/NAD(P)-dependent dehydrogenase (short-subunit alcohol dehydrogenase family)